MCRWWPASVIVAMCSFLVGCGAGPTAQADKRIRPKVVFVWSPEDIAQLPTDEVWLRVCYDPSTRVWGGETRDDASFRIFGLLTDFNHTPPFSDPNFGSHYGGGES